MDSRFRENVALVSVLNMSSLDTPQPVSCDDCMIHPQTISSYVEARKDELLGILAELVAAKTENPPGDEALAAEVVRRRFADWGIPCDIHEGAPGRANAVGRVGGGPPSLLLAGHLDVVPAGEGWDGDPFALRVEDGVAFGRGVCDDKGPMACAMLAARFLHETMRPKGTLLAAGLADEERGSAWGLEYLLREGLIAPDMAIVPDIGGRMAEIDVAEKGALFVKVSSFGRQAHGSKPETGENAIVHMMSLLRLIQQGPPLRGTHPLLSPPTLNIGQIEGGTAPNMVPAKCSARLDVRFLPAQTAEEVLDGFRKLARKAEADSPGARFEVECEAALPPTEIPPDHAMVRHYQEAVQTFAGRQARPVGVSGATVTKQLVARGIPAIGVGAGDADQAHMANESIEVQELLDFAKVLALTAAKLLK